MFDVVIIGAGPAGLMCALNLDKNLKVLIIDKNNTIGKKLLLTGGGRCNITNNKSNKDFLEEIKHNKKYLYSTINNFGPSDILEYFKDIDFIEEEENKIFLKSGNSNELIKNLENRLTCKINYNEKVVNINIEDDFINVITNKGIINTKNVVFATGGASYKGTGSTADHIKFAKNLDIDTVNLYPVENSIIIKDTFDLSGTSISEVTVSANKHKKTGNVMFTHNGLSGSSIMKISEYIYLENIKNIKIDFLPNLDLCLLKDSLELSRNNRILEFLNSYFSKKFSIFLLNKSNIDKSSLIKQINHKELNLLLNNLKDMNIEIKKVSPIELAYATGGGINLKEINTKTFATHKYNNIYFIGESLDIHGPIGGYNITLAMSTGYSASLDINKKTSL